jgi:hypothetical protein
MSILRSLQDTLPPTNTRVEHSTPELLNEQIAAQTAVAVAQFQGATREEITRRLEELDREWDIERTLEANAATLAFTGAALALTVNRKFAWISAGVTGFLLQHALQGWCPPVPLFRRAGVRTQREIHEEKTALRILRGDFEKAADARDAIRQVRA